jgi:hypothetical protein
MGPTPPFVALQRACNVLASCCSSGHDVSLATAHPTRGLSSFSPGMLAVVFFFLSDIDSPRHGLIRVIPQNLVSLAASMRTLD